MISFLIGTQGHGRGGHFRDVVVIARALSRQFDVQIVNLGKRSPVLDSSEVRVINCYPTRLGAVFSALRSSDFIFAIDVRVAFIAYQTALITGSKLVHIKPGGVNDDFWQRDLQNVIVFSKENYDFIKSGGAQTVALIPDRVEVPKTNHVLLKELRRNYEKHKVILYVSRITNHYASNLRKVVRLAVTLEELGGKDIKVVIIGQVESESLLTDLLNLAPKNLDIITDTKYTENAASVLCLGDLVIGNGRTVMEAASLGIPLLVNSTNSNTPIVLTAENFEDFSNYNFSPRAASRSHGTPERIIKLLGDNAIYQTLSQSTHKLYEANFSIANLVPKYVSFMGECRPESWSFRFFLSLVLRYVKFCVRSSQ